MASLTDRERALRLQFRDDFEFYAPRVLKIRTKDGPTLPFRLNRTQLALHHRLEKQRAETGKVRAIVLKGRQVGISTYIGGRFYWRVSHSPGSLCQILTHLDDASANLFQMARRFHDFCPDVLRPSTGAANAKELMFDKLGSGYKVSTAGSQAVGRSSTLQMFHGSEVAFWPHAGEHFAGIMQALSKGAGSECVLESTANGIGNTFHRLWQAAERGDSEFEPIFLPWFWHEEYHATPPEGWQPSGEWADYEVAHKLKREQTYWAYCTSRDMCAASGGDQSEVHWQFKQEYPSTAAEAFQTSGNSFISAIAVLKARKAQVEPYGPIILGVDLARGGGDKTAIIDRQGRRLGKHVCRLVDHRDTMQTVGEILQEAKRLYPLGLRRIVVDATGLGGPVYDRLKEIQGVRDLVLGVNFGSRAFDVRKYANRRAEMWDTMRQWIEDSDAPVQVPDSDAFQADVCAPVRGAGATGFNSNQQLVLESKDHIRERLGNSPDIGDAAALTFAIDPAQPFDLDDDDDFDRPRGSRVENTTGY